MAVAELYRRGAIVGFTAVRRPLGTPSAEPVADEAAAPTVWDRATWKGRQQVEYVETAAQTAVDRQLMQQHPPH